MWIFFWIIMGFIVGAPAKFLMPGKDPGGIFGTILIGSQELLSGVLLGQKWDWEQLRGLTRCH
jgi:uncharacterized membrane protein YeaQ/YmgE (transglycosylase-associated protein family)